MVTWSYDEAFLPYGYGVLFLSPGFLFHSMQIAENAPENVRKRPKLHAPMMSLNATLAIQIMTEMTLLCS